MFLDGLCLESSGQMADTFVGHLHTDGRTHYDGISQNQEAACTVKTEQDRERSSVGHQRKEMLENIITVKVLSDKYDFNNLNTYL